MIDALVLIGFLVVVFLIVDIFHRKTNPYKDNNKANLSVLNIKDIIQIHNQSRKLLTVENSTKLQESVATLQTATTPRALKNEKVENLLTKYSPELQEVSKTLFFLTNKNVESIDIQIAVNRSNYLFKELVPKLNKLKESKFK